jgi:hypothetical protein
VVVKKKHGKMALDSLMVGQGHKYVCRHVAASTEEVCKLMDSCKHRR